MLLNSAIFASISLLMPITKQAKKAIRSSANKRVFNDRRRKAMKEAVKSVITKVVAKDRKGAEAIMPTAYKAIDKAAKRGVIKANAAARKKSNDDIEEGELDTWGALLAILSTIIGGGMVSFPWAVYTCGIPVGILILLMSCA